MPLHLKSDDPNSQYWLWSLFLFFILFFFSPHFTFRHFFQTSTKSIYRKDYNLSKRVKTKKLIIYSRHNFIISNLFVKSLLWLSMMQINSTQHTGFIQLKCERNIDQAPMIKFTWKIVIHKIVQTEGFKREVHNPD